MLYSWRSVGVVVFLVVVGVLGWRLHDHGYQAGQRDCSLSHAQAADAAAARARAAAEAQSQRDRTAARANAAARIDQLRRRNALETDIARRPTSVDCGLDAGAMQLFNDAVRAGNTTPDVAASPVPDGVPAGTGADRREPAGPAPLGR